jgi:alpha-tubulin suppressor-like RCC1 family protein
MFLTDDGIIYMFGSNERGQCAVDPTSTTPQYYVTTPTYVTGLLTGKTIVSASIGQSYGRWAVGAIDTDGWLYLWGDNVYGQLGYTTPLGYSYTPTTPDGLTGIAFKKVIFHNCGTPSTYALTRDGRLFSVGYNDRGQLGNGEYGSYHTSFREIVYPANIKGHIVDVGIHGATNEWTVHEYPSAWILTDDGDLYGTGDNQGTQLGHQRYSYHDLGLTFGVTRYRGYDFDLSRVFRKINRPS